MEHRPPADEPAAAPEVPRATDRAAPDELPRIFGIPIIYIVLAGFVILIAILVWLGVLSGSPL
ncbi:MAG TPA: hypothetical protein VKY74_18295 [Chloroflexia bacterium]|nr:hypothetical protein [Chloroflexia bacterium]